MSYCRRQKGKTKKNETAEKENDGMCKSCSPRVPRSAGGKTGVVPVSRFTSCEERLRREPSTSNASTDGARGRRQRSDHHVESRTDEPPLQTRSLRKKKTRVRDVKNREIWSLSRRHLALLEGSLRLGSGSGSVVENMQRRAHVDSRGQRSLQSQ